MSKELFQPTSEWGPGARPGEPSFKSEQQFPPTSRSRSAGGLSAANVSKLGDMNNGGNAPTDSGTIKKKKRAPKFLVKQFGMNTKGPTGASPRRSLKLLGKDYVVAVPGSAPASRALASTSETTSVDPDPNLDDRSLNAASAAPPIDSRSAPVDQADRNVAKPPIEFVIAPVDYKTEQREDVREEPEPPFDFVIKRSRRIPSPVATSIRGHGSLSRSHSSLGRSPSGSERWSYSAATPRSERSVLSVPETVMISSANEQGDSRETLNSASRTTSPSSLAEWSGGSLGRHGELSIAALSLAEGRDISGLSCRTDLTSAQSPARSETQALDYRPDDTDSGVEMYHETTSASPGSYSRRSSCSLSENWISDFEDSDGVSHHYRRSKHRNDHRSRSFGDSSHSRSQSGSARYSPSGSTRNKGQYSPNTLGKFVSKQFLDSPSGKMRHHGDYYDHRRNVDPSMANSSNFSSRRHGSQKRRDDAHSAAANTKVVVLLGKYGRKKGNHGTGAQSVEIDDTVALDSMTPQEAVAVFHDEVARMMLEEGEECVEANDVEEFLDGYMRLRSPFYVAMVDEFFRALCVDCYKRPVEIPVDSRSGTFSSSSKSVRSDSQLHHFHNCNMRM